MNINDINDINDSLSIVIQHLDVESIQNLQRTNHYLNNYISNIKRFIARSILENDGWNVYIQEYPRRYISVWGKCSSCVSFSTNIFDKGNWEFIVYYIKYEYFGPSSIRDLTQSALSCSIS